MLTVREHMALDLASRRFPKAVAGRRAELAIEVLGYPSETRFAQVVDALLDRPDAEAERPQLVHRLRRLRDVRRAARRGHRAA